MFPIIYGILAKLGAVSPVDNWWESGGSSGAVAVYQPIGAADLANSYTDLSGNGNDAAPGVAPTWDSVGGWDFDGVTQYLDSGIVPALDYTVVCRYDSVVDGNVQILYGVANAAGTDEAVSFYPDGSSGAAVYGWRIGAAVYTVPVVLSGGVVASAGYRAYIDGVIQTTLASIGNDPAVPLYIGAQNRNGASTVGFFGGKIKAVAIYDNTLDAAQVLAVSDAMAAL